MLNYFEMGLFQMIDVIVDTGEKENMLFHALNCPPVCLTGGQFTYEQCADILMNNKMMMDHLYINMLQ